MPRPPQPREIYDEESATLLRIVRLVRADVRRSDEWKKRAERALMEANRILIERVPDGEER